MSSPFQRKFSSNSPLHGAYESAADSSRYISNAKDFQKLQDTIVKTGLAAKDRVDQVDQWKSEANSMDWDSVNVYGADGRTVIGQRATAKGKLNRAHYGKYGPKKRTAEEKCINAGGRYDGKYCSKKSIGDDNEWPDEEKA
tara:strand:- start:75 stop:497 length:423 start_codon:yes stop_codon:yes gene_type:complete